MSLILDALRKMEEERQARRGQNVDIRPIVLHKRRPAAAPARPRVGLVIGCLLLLAGGIGAGVYLYGRDPVQPTAGPAPAATAMPAQPAPAVPAATTPAPPAPLPAPASPTPAPTPHRPAATTPATPAAEGAEPGLTISGIAWQEERELRRAVVNGALVAEGAEVAGARVVEIRERSVRFSRGGRTFDIGYSSPFPR